MSDSSRRPLLILDWEFSLVPEAEVHSCLRYEYAREIPDYLAYFEQDEKMIAAREKWRRKHKNYEFTPADYHSFLEVIVREIDVFEPGSIPYEFPECTWQELPQSLREKIVFVHTAKTMGVTTDIPAPHLTPKMRQKLAAVFGRQSVPLSISWRHSDIALMEDFRRWVEENRPPNIPITIDRSVQSMRDDLNALGALRLRHHYTTSEAYSLTREFVGKPLYAAPFSWDRAAARAINKFGEMFGSVVGPKSAKSKPNQRGRPTKEQVAAQKSLQSVHDDVLAQIDAQNAAASARLARDRADYAARVAAAVRDERE